MSRDRLLLAVLAVALCQVDGRAQSQQAGSLAERLGLMRTSDAPAHTARRDPRFTPAAATSAPKRSKQAQSPREAAQQSNTRSAKSKGGTFLSGLHLPAFLQGDQETGEPPQPYGQSSANQSAASQARASQTKKPSPSAAANVKRIVAGAGQPQSNQSRPRTNSAEQAAQSPAANMQARRVASSQQQAAKSAAPTAQSNEPPRRSPTPSSHRNELAEALSGLRSQPTGAPQATRAVAAEAATASPAELPPVMASEADLPDYLTAETDDAGPAAESADEEAAAPVDLHAALTPSRTVTRPAAPAKPQAEPQVATTRAPSASRYSDSPVAEESESGQVGRIPAKPAPRALAASSGPRRTVQLRANGSAGNNSRVSTPAANSLAAEAFAATAPARAPLPQLSRAAAPPAATAAPAEVDTRPRAAVAAPTAGNILMSCRQPVIVSKVEGPQRVVAGRQAEYRITLQNAGDTTARDLIATIEAPATADVADASASGGVVDRAADVEANQPVANAVKWQLYELQPGATQTLTLQLIPRSGRDMQLSVRWSHAPVSVETTVEVQEPKLRMEISGPVEVLFGRAQRYTLVLANPGTGTAEDVAIELLPPGGDQSSMVHHKVGVIAAGETKKIELELTAREAGELKIQASAVAAGDLRTEAVKTVLCRRPELQVDWRGPEKEYAGAVATYFFRVRNPGTAATDGVSVKLNLPAGAELVDASDGQTYDADHRVLSWPAAGLSAGDERFMQVRCRFTQPGVNRLELAAQSGDGLLSDVKSAEVNIVALADLKLEVVDPKGASPVGETAVYEIHIKNRGLTAARGVNVVAMFSEGIEPSHVEGAPHSIRDGRVAFRTIDNLAAGAEAVLRIEAVASKAGNHLFRAEVLCDDIDTKLAAEETTKFFSQESKWEDASTAYSDDPSTVKR